MLIRVGLTVMSQYLRQSLNLVTSFTANIEDTTKPSVLIVVPHSSIFDLMVVAFLGIPTFVARQATSTSWVIGRFVKLCDPILVNRECSDSRLATKLEIAERAKNGEAILLLPEGTCTNRQMLLQFKDGAFKPGLPVQPIFLQFVLDDRKL